jgi:ABC-2 type transport system permease protein
VAIDPSLSGVRYASVFKYYGNAIEDGIEPLAFVGVVAVATLIAFAGGWLIDQRDIST